MADLYRLSHKTMPSWQPGGIFVVANHFLSVTTHGALCPHNWGKKKVGLFHVES